MTQDAAARRPAHDHFSEHRVASPPVSADKDAYRNLCARSASSVAVVTAFTGGWDYAAPVTDYLSVSYDPPTMLASLYGLSRITEGVEQAGEWALSILADDQHDIVDFLHDPGGPLMGMLDQVPHSRADADGPAIIDGAITWFQLRTVAQHTAATHELFVGEVTAMGRANSFRADPLVSVRGGLRGV